LKNIIVGLHVPAILVRFCMGICLLGRDCVQAACECQENKSDAKETLCSTADVKMILSKGR